MLLKAYSIYDRKGLRYMTPFFKTQDGEATRDFADLCNDLQTTVGRHPNDYVLFNIGNYSDQDGLFVPETPLRHIADGNSLVRPSPMADMFGQKVPEEMVRPLRTEPNGKAPDTLSEKVIR